MLRDMMELLYEVFLKKKFNVCKTILIMVKIFKPIYRMDANEPTYLGKEKFLWMISVINLLAPELFFKF